MIAFLKSVASRLPGRYQQELKRLHFGRMITKGTFTSAEEHDTEFARLDQWVSPGDWAVDVGANVGNYSARLSQLVGEKGRVFSFEPVFETFELLTANMARMPIRNITLFNVAASDSAGVHGMLVPRMTDGLENRYMAHLSEDPGAQFAVMCLPLDAVNIPKRVKLIKIDVEGHELSALRGMRKLLERDHPILIVEGRSAEVAGYLAGLGYVFEEMDRSPNRVFKRAQ